MATPSQVEYEAIEQFRAKLLGYCYRMLGSVFDADDAVQDTLLRAWQGRELFAGRSSVLTWLYRIATNVCLDRLRSKRANVLPMQLGDPGSAHAEIGEPHPELPWLEPILDADVVAPQGDPAEVAIQRETIRLAFVAVLQCLPPRQRAILLLRDVMCWSASEVAEALGTTVSAVNSGLQRARASMAEERARGRLPAVPTPGHDPGLLDRYLQAFERYDIDALVEMLNERAGMSMPPFVMWLRGRSDLRDWYLGQGIGCQGSRLLPIGVNGGPGFAQYRRGTQAGEFVPWSIQVLEVRDESITHIHCFLDTTLFARFGLPPQIGLSTPVQNDPSRSRRRRGKFTDTSMMRDGNSQLNDAM